MVATLDEKTHPDAMVRTAEFGVGKAVEHYLKVLSTRCGVEQLRSDRHSRADE
jgi:hypothetical protein